MDLRTPAEPVAPLTRDTCRELADLYPEVREHKAREGDLYYIGGEIANIVAPQFVSPVDEWCPRLDDLLEIARSKVPIPGFYLYLCQTVPDGSQWQFGVMDIDWEPTADLVRADSRADAVAAWLLARRRAAS